MGLIHKNRRTVPRYLFMIDLSKRVESVVQSFKQRGIKLCKRK